MHTKAIRNNLTTERREPPLKNLHDIVSYISIYSEIVVYVKMINNGKKIRNEEEEEEKEK